MPACPEPERDARHVSAGRRLWRRPELAETFDRVGDGYDARPGYPTAVFDTLSGRCGLGPGARVLEIGPGTGQATLPMLDRGAAVTAVEPGASLARRLGERTVDRAIEIVVSKFEDATVAENSFNLVASATAFHWVDTAVGLQRCADALVDGGHLALWWTVWGDPDRPDPFHEALVPVLCQRAPHLVAEEAGAVAYQRDMADRAEDIASVGTFEPATEETFTWDGTHDPASLRAIFATFGAWIALSEPLRTELLDELENVAQRQFAGLVTRPYETVLYTARRRPR